MQKEGRLGDLQGQERSEEGELNYVVDSEEGVFGLQRAATTCGLKNHKTLISGQKCFVESHRYMKKLAPCGQKPF